MIPACCPQGLRDRRGLKAFLDFRELPVRLALRGLQALQALLVPLVRKVLRDLRASRGLRATPSVRTIVRRP